MNVCSRTTNIMISNIQQRALRLIINYHTSNFDTLLESNNDTCNNHKIIQTLMLEIYKILNNLNPLIMDLCLRGETAHIILEN